MSRRGGFFGSLATGLAGGLAQSTKDIGRRLIESQRYADAQQRYQQREATRQAERRETMDIQRAMRDAQEQKYLFDRAASMIPQSQRARAFAETGGNLAGATPEQLRGYADAARQQQLDDYNRELEGRKQLLRMQLAARNRGGGKNKVDLSRQEFIGEREALGGPVRALYSSVAAIDKQLQKALEILDPTARAEEQKKLLEKKQSLQQRIQAATPAYVQLTQALAGKKTGVRPNVRNLMNALESYYFATTGERGDEQTLRYIGSQLGLLSPNAQLTPGVSGLSPLMLRSYQQ
tara:strand:- start:500 stop:1375 length:876 start_codon:yes stop_codon:yes gene_type:complete